MSASWYGITYPYSFQGEESAEFTNTLGENIRVRVCSSIEETSQLLSRVLDGRQSAADLLAKEVHSENSYYGVGHELIDQVPEDQFNVDNLGIWIDPIGETTKRPKDFFFEINTSKRIYKFLLQKHLFSLPNFTLFHLYSVSFPCRRNKQLHTRRNSCRRRHRLLRHLPDPGLASCHCSHRSLWPEYRQTCRRSRKPTIRQVWPQREKVKTFI